MAEAMSSRIVMPDKIIMAMISANTGVGRPTKCLPEGKVLNLARRIMPVTTTNEAMTIATQFVVKKLK